MSKRKFRLWIKVGIGLVLLALILYISSWANLGR